MHEHTYHVYIMASRSLTLYIGFTSNIDKRVHQHKAGVFDGFSKKYNCHRLVYLERYQTALAGIARKTIEALVPRKEACADSRIKSRVPGSQRRLGKANLSNQSLNGPKRCHLDRRRVAPQRRDLQSGPPRKQLDHLEICYLDDPNAVISTEASRRKP
jgi:putative endonuclease